MSDLTVDFDLLKESARQLGEIQKEFKDLEDWRDDITSVVGAPQIKDAMKDFTDNWDKNRKRLLESLETVGKMVEGTREAFKGLDDDLAQANKKK
ncbi:hypothetical protein [Streptomyces sp. NPDC005017]|uniref:hypothetical protein n=1 Tax=Streptomyces sp. NPDC005017 TaxID=3364706 RepID=UPI00367EE513